MVRFSANISSVVCADCDAENHFVLKPENSILWHKTVLDWINEHVGLPKYGEDSELVQQIVEEATLAGSAERS